MRYLLLVSHGTMAPGVHSVIRMLMGERENVLSHSMEDGVSTDEFVAGLRETLRPVRDGDSLIVLADIVGGSPLTDTLALLEQTGMLSSAMAFGGLSLPMAICAVTAIEDGVDDATLAATVLAEARVGACQVV